MSDAYGSQRWVSFYNDSGKVIPSYAVIMLVSDRGEPDTTVNFCKRLRVRQFSDTDGVSTQFENEELYALNSRVPVQPETYGKCTFALDGPAWARIKESDLNDGTTVDSDTDWIGRLFGPLTDRWSVGFKTAHPVFKLLARPDAERERVLVLQNAPIIQKAFLLGDSFLGNRDSGGVVTEAEVRLSVGGVDITAYAEDYPLLIAPGQALWVQRAYGRWVPIQGGQENYYNALTKEDINPSGDAYVRLDDTLGFPRGSDPVIEVYQPRTSEPVPNNTRISFAWDSLSKVAYITGAACPP